MFPHQETHITWDEYGLTVKGEEVLLIIPCVEFFFPLVLLEFTDHLLSDDVCASPCARCV